MQPPSIPFPLHKMGFMCEDCTSQSANGINIHQVIVGGHDSSLDGGSRFYHLQKHHKELPGTHVLFVLVGNYLYSYLYLPCMK